MTGSQFRGARIATKRRAEAQQALQTVDQRLRKNAAEQLAPFAERVHNATVEMDELLRAIFAEQGVKDLPADAEIGVTTENGTIGKRLWWDDGKPAEPVARLVAEPEPAGPDKEET